jgi:colicin import membrane protein
MSHAATFGSGLAVPRTEPGKNVSLALTIAVHLALAVFLVYGIHWQTTAPEAVEVELVRAAPEPAPVPAPAPVVEPAPAPKVEAKPAPPPPKPEIAIKEKTKPVKQEARPKTPPVDPFAEQLRREDERLDQRKAVAAAGDELARLKSARAVQAATARNKAVASYMDKIRAKVRGNLIPPPGLKGNPEAIFEVIQLPGGEVISTKLIRSSGNAALDDAIERAILKSSPLPKPEQGDIFDRALKLTLRPFADQ